MLGVQEQRERRWGQRGVGGGEGWRAGKEGGVSANNTASYNPMDECQNVFMLALTQIILHSN